MTEDRRRISSENALRLRDHLPCTRPGVYSQRPLVCPICRRRFHLAARLKRHYKGEHLRKEISKFG